MSSSAPRRWVLRMGSLSLLIVASLLAESRGQESPPTPTPDNSANFAKFQQAQARHIAGELDAARAQLAELLAADPRNFDLALAIAKWLEEQRGDFVGAEPFARRAFELRPDSIEVVNLFGAALTMSGRAADSEPLFAAAAERHPDSALLWFGLAIARAQQRRFLEARAALDRALALAPGNGLYRFSSGENHANLREYAAAEADFAAAVKLEGHADAAWRLGEMLALQGKGEAAERALRSALHQGPKSARWNAALQLGIWCFEHERAQEAVGLLHQATQVKPEGRDAWMWLARAQRAIGKADAAARSIKKYQALRASDDRAEEEHLLSLIRPSQAADVTNLADDAPHFATAPDGVPIAYRVHGAGTPLLVLIHGWSCDSGYWHEQLPLLTPDHAVLTVDLAGHGASGRDREGWTIAKFGADVVAAVRDFQRADLDAPRSIVLIGHSMGGPVAVEAARQLGAEVRAIIGVDTFSTLGAPPYPPAEVEKFLAGFEADFAGTTRAWVTASMFPPTSDPAFVSRIADAMAQAPPTVAIGAMRGLLDHLGRSDYRDLSVPVVAINADLEGVTDEARARTVAPTFRLVTMAGRGHFLMLEDPAGFNEVLRQELARLAP